ncbi:cell wall-binding protein [Clostridium carboxidivorans P7]|uniref:Putative cell wall binding repeat 2-containing protein n=1 Tax=Clostridium carboxidivorans P7 TaxID=536227 RepID=C6PU39_9CLOT|nr:leucine-rich repeat domain-containing protein [Clostridium carboxidivorans]AKN33842.1 cell wall-binding protein [Clostridium carboxidivorans P7]EET87239.1 putative cell wall binding repeat 2-containing protein [Clostridium carboxidivorans P7]EFG86545.1 leucine Rich repeat protein [Clostridium carboxidivorans P7]
MKIKLLFISCVLGTSLLFSSSVFAKNNININRLSGQDRYGTSNAIVSKGWTKSNYAVLVNSQNFPDAITASPLAKKYNAPILLTDANSLTDSTKEKLQSLGVENIFIIGGTGVVSSHIENTLESMGISVKRIWGQDRYETSINVAKELGSSKGMFVVNGEHYEDALSAAPIADKLQYPIILISKNSVPDIVNNYVNNIKNNGGAVEVIGGEDMLTNAAVSSLNPTKIYNQSSKYDRNLALINNYKGQLDLSKVYISSDKGFADALSGSALAGQNGNPIILVGDSNQSNVNSFISNNNVTNVNVLGGTGVLSDHDVNVVIGNMSATNNIVTFKDKNLEKAIRATINKPTGELLKSDVNQITELDVSIINEHTDIKDISGLENLTNLQILALTDTEVSDLSPLKNLTNLQKLNLRCAQVSDISPLKYLTNLQNLNLWCAQVSDISPLKDLTNLQKLDLHIPQISDTSALKNLTNLQQLSLQYTQVSHINGLENLTNLQQLNLDRTQVSDISGLKDLTNLQKLNLNNNQVSNISPLKYLTNLQELDLSSNQVSDISPLKYLTNLQKLDLNNNQVSDVSPLKYLTNLQDLLLNVNQISDISPLKDLINLQGLYLGINQISDISPLKYLINLRELNLKHTQVSDADKQSLKNALPNCVFIDFFEN